MLLATGCTVSGTGGPLYPESKDCAARLRFEGRTYHGVRLVRMPRTDGALGTGIIPECDGKTVADRVRVSRVDGIPVADALMVNGYVWVTGRRDRLPDSLREANEKVPCAGTARFTGTWLGADAEEDGNDVLHPPYNARFRAREGTGLPLVRWTTVEIQARVTSDTSPVPSRDFVHQALGEDHPVTVVAHCEGERFEVDEIALAR
ncbi:hypothetical protein [Streptomyces meridianus]|uniref:Lipoprotein n=1 Tax=Streptomyces meridianus TaxID=2938945 RepID=A0ABT0X4V3_9ACTN|nr:hypothetical protein [Streptomyces meridianus]MCM2577571.1 hypothetical protein [Streptomyces meridianus]